ncbi:MAG: DUF115 domain-containing protein [Hadesarchaea archaeon]|nr:DUF115 domain-containing protein [Hadesarchaea archaeon]
MNWEKWQPWYEKISRELNLKKEKDEEAARILSELVPNPSISELKKLINNRECMVFGAGPSLSKDLEKLSESNNLDRVLIPADGATGAVIDYRVPEVIVTDLDGNIEPQLRAWREGAWLVIHGHGDNIPELRRVLPKLSERVIGTTQVKPHSNLYNFGGFTDGDRAAFMSHELGASKIYLVGMDLGSEIGDWSGDKNKEEKIPKLRICRGLLSWLSSDLQANLINLTSNGEKIPNVPEESK